MKEMLAAPLPHITHFLASVLATVQDQLKVITVKCYSSWMTLGAISLDTVRGCDVGTLSSPNSFPSPPPARGCQWLHDLPAGEDREVLNKFTEEPLLKSLQAANNITLFHDETVDITNHSDAAVFDM